MSSNQGNENPNKRPPAAVFLKATPKKKKFGSFVNSPGASTPGGMSSVGTPTGLPKSTVKLIILKPDSDSPYKLCGVVVVPVGFMADKFLGDILTKKASLNPVTANFIEKVDCIPFVVFAKDANGQVMRKDSKDGVAYAFRATFLPFAAEDIDNKDMIEQKVRLIGKLMYTSIKSFPRAYKEMPCKGKSEFPKDVDWDNDVRYAKTLNDAVGDNDDNDEHKMVYMCAKLGLDNGGADLKAWLKAPGHNHLYNLFNTEGIPGKFIQHWNIPFECLLPKDMTAYTKWKAEMDEYKEHCKEDLQDQMDAEQYWEAVNGEE